MIIFVCGLSKSGKTSTIKAAHIENLGIKYEKASAILAEAGQPIVDLLAADVIPNQKKLVGLLSTNLATESRPVLIDGHLLVETREGPQLVPEALLDPLPIFSVITIEATPSEVAERRAGTTLALLEEEAADRLALERLQARRFARHRKVQNVVVRCGDSESLKRELTSTLSAMDAVRH